MVKVIGLRNLSRGEILEVIFEKEGIQLEGAIQGDFPEATKELVLKAGDVTSIVNQQVKEKLSEVIQNFTASKATTDAFTRGFIFVVALALTKQRKSVRKEVIACLLEIFNSFVS